VLEEFGNFEAILLAIDGVSDPLAIEGPLKSDTKTNSALGVEWPCQALL
jgi:hypothetical protein